jgi:hypothetical protein
LEYPAIGQETWKSPLDYPRTYLDDGIGAIYKNRNRTTYFRKKLNELETILSSTNPFLQRMFQRGYNLVEIKWHKIRTSIQNLSYVRRIKDRVMAGSKGGKPGQWSARKAQLVAQQYEKAWWWIQG